MVQKLPCNPMRSYYNNTTQCVMVVGLSRLLTCPVQSPAEGAVGNSRVSPQHSCTLSTERRYVLLAFKKHQPSPRSNTKVPQEISTTSNARLCTKNPHHDQWAPRQARCSPDTMDWQLGFMRSYTKGCLRLMPHAVLLHHNCTRNGGQNCLKTQAATQPA